MLVIILTLIVKRDKDTGYLNTTRRPVVKPIFNIRISNEFIFFRKRIGQSYYEFGDANVKTDTT